ncbi:Pectin lyase fold/virulence factor [Apiospora marii]|uniref:Pectin lyase fold/virulence factor n=1 Tax=Apiospora marii TaxID=335849 RepID=A0ABR1SHQ4_9PEZI
MPPIVTVNPLPTIPLITTTDKAVEPLATFSAWPAGAIIIPVAVEVDKPKKSDDDDESSVIPCKLWFSSLCIKFDAINILGWKLTLPPGIYPPGPPPIPNIKLPPPISIKGSLPPWPKFTVGNDHIPTFPSEPEPTKCETQTASICSTTTSFVVSTVDGAPQTISTQVGSSTCAEVKGCMVTDSDHEATATRTEACQTATVTDVTISCSGTGTASVCSTQTAAPKTGCSESVTASTTTLSCKAAAPTAGPSKRQAGGGGGQDACAEVKEWLVWPEDGMDKTQTEAISTKLKEILVDEHKIVVSDTKFAGVNFWIVTLEAGQEAEIKAIEHAVSVYPRCTKDCGDPTAESNWRYQSKYIKGVEKSLTSINDGIPQMAFLSQSKDERTYPIEQVKSYQRYFFDESAGEGVPVYIVDSGANLEHPEFNDIRHKVEFIQVSDKDIGGDSANDDSQLLETQRCWQVCKGHGTAMLGFIAGARLGVAKKVKPYLVRVPRRSPFGGGSTAEDWLVGVAKVLERYEKPSDTTLAVLSLSWYVTENMQDRHPAEGKGEDTFLGFRNRLAALINLLIRNGVFVVTGSGNDGPIYGWPSLFGVPHTKVWDQLDKYRSTWHYIPELMVVGALDPVNGRRWWKSGHSTDDEMWFPELYAPGARLIAAAADKTKWPRWENTYERPPPKEGDLPEELSYYKDSAGTSDAAAYTAGLAAYFLRLHQLGRLPKDATGEDPDMSPAGLKRYIINNAWHRGGPDADEKYRPRRTLGIWNGSPPERVVADGFCPWEQKAPAKLRRSGEQEQLTGQCMPPQTAMPTAAGTGQATISPTATGASTGSPPDPSATGFVCSEERCAAMLNCHVPTRPGCKDDKCACLGDADGATFQCTEETKKECSPCQAPEEAACDKDRKCTCTRPPTTMTTRTKTSPAPPPPPPPPPPTQTPLAIGRGEEQCREPFEHPDMTSYWVEDFASLCFDQYPRKMDSKSERVVVTRPGGDDHGVMYMAVSWIQDCRTAVDSQDALHPLSEAPDGADGKEIDCQAATWDIWKTCLNGGSGGKRRIGCLMYEWAPADSPA